jgi:hypothetical protein
MAVSGDAVSPAERAHALQALEAQARLTWWTAYNVDIVAGARTAASMLEDGPTGANVAAAVMVGLLPLGQPWNPLWPISQTLQHSGLSPFDIPFPLVLQGGCPLDEDDKLLVDGATDGAELANALQLPFAQGLMQMLGGEVGDAGVDAVNEDMGTCIDTIDPPQHHEPPHPHPEQVTDVVDEVLGAAGDVTGWAGNAAVDAAEWNSGAHNYVDEQLSQGLSAAGSVLEDLAQTIEDSPLGPIAPVEDRARVPGGGQDRVRTPRRVVARPPALNAVARQQEARCRQIAEPLDDRVEQGAGHATGAPRRDAAPYRNAHRAGHASRAKGRGQQCSVCLFTAAAMC